MPELYRYKMKLPSGKGGYDSCSTFIVGAGIFLVLITLVTTGAGGKSASNESGLVFILLAVLIVLNLLARHWYWLRFFIITICCLISLPLFYLSTSLFLSDDIEQSKMSIFLFAVAIYTFGVALIEVREIKRESALKN